MTFIVFIIGAAFGVLIGAIAQTIGVDLVDSARRRRHTRRLRIDGRLPSGRVISLEGWRRR